MISMTSSSLPEGALTVKIDRPNISETENRRFRERNLILDWGKLKVEISKLPYSDGVKDPMFDLFKSDVILANVYKNPDGRLEDEILGAPAGYEGGGQRIQIYFTDDDYWHTPDEHGHDTTNHDLTE